MSVDERLRQVLADVFGVKAEDVKEDASPHTIAAWDSVAHLSLVFALEAEFSIQFEAEDIPELNSFRAIHERVAELERVNR